ncbi:ABC transporter permease [Paenibacillus antibioticophila]|uniref:Glutathione ABC transporter permease GsiD n=1 Tax=Paenibacillus antibioticophila TaxID=1274374 RepID=A0A919XR40_9BACL|nr:ABC transporter permease [Paenibacillus antibioticophila]GIO35978.1 glutathione ABC transporter permease GsiD [Paenibacillus antibioticophila]
MRKGKNNRLVLLGIALVSMVVLLCLTSFIYLPHDPNNMNTIDRLHRPSGEYFLGTDQFGRDILSRIMISTRYALLVGLVSVAVGASIGVVIGSIGGIAKGVLQSVIMRVIDGFMAFPGMLLALMLVAVTGKGLWNAVLAIAIFMIPTYARLAYSLVIDQKNELYIKAAKSYGATPWRIIVKHILPSMLPKLITQFSSSIGGAILLESSLSFLGLGVQPPNASLGLMLSESRQFTLSYPYLAIPSGIVLVIAILGFNLIGDALNDTTVGRRKSV